MTRLLIIVQAENLAAIRVAAGAFFGELAATAFVPAGSATGEAPATHWWLSGVFVNEDVEKITTLQTSFPTALVEYYDLATHPGRPWTLLAQCGLKPMSLENPT